MQLCVLGEFLIDFTPQGSTADGLPLLAQSPGGAPVNVACAAQKLGVRAGVITKVSSDPLGRFLYAYLQKLRLDLSGVCRSDDPTGLAFVTLDENGERDFCFYRSGCADSMLREEELNESCIRSADVFHFSSVSLVAEPARSATFAAAVLAKRLGKCVSFDINYRPALWESEQAATAQIARALRLADVVKASGEEAALFGKTPKEAAAHFLSCGASLALLTFGDAGSSYHTAAFSGEVPAFSVKAVDATGAGDCFMGAFLARLLESGCAPSRLTEPQLAAMLLFANAAGAICASRFGAIAGQPTREEVLRVLAGG